RIRTLTLELALPDTEIIRILQEEGFKISRSSLYRRRIDMGIVRKVRGIDA
ncbi:hypothetical protein EJ05DRAFT_446525, partial [Pseudovirgaria hyperparasitica]